MATIRIPVVRSKDRRGVSLWVLLLSNLLVFQLMWILISLMGNTNDDILLEKTTTKSPSILNYSLVPLKEKATALPSIRIQASESDSDNIYGGKGDKPHLGGFTDLDVHGICPSAWRWMVRALGIHSLLDVGCGKGVSTSWFYYHGVDVLCVEGSHDAFENSILPDPAKQIVEHDFSRGPWWPERTYDAIWCVEFLEHVGRNFQKNYLPAFRKSALIFASHSTWGGHHHVEVHDESYWINKMTMFGFVYSEPLTFSMRKLAKHEMYSGFAPNGLLLNPQHIWLNLKVFINPAVASLPEHAHIFAEPGCFLKRVDGVRMNRECGTGDDPQAKIESTLPIHFKPLSITKEQDEEWFQRVKSRVPDRTEEGKRQWEELEEEESERKMRKKKKANATATVKA